MVRNHIADGATVTESVELLDRVTGEPREVDICIEGTVGGAPTIVCIECRAATRKADVTWVEAMTGKHNDLPTNVLILYSRSGFTQAAVDKAKFYNKPIVALRTLNDATAEGLFGGAGSVWVKTCSLTPTKIIFRVPESHGLAAENVNMFPDHGLYNHDGQVLGIAKDWVELMLRSPASMSELLKRGNQTHKGFEIRTYPWDPPLWEGKSLFLQKNDQDPPVLRPVETVTVIGHSNFDVGQFQMQHGKLDNITVAWGTGMFKGEETLLVASKDEKDEIKLSVAYAKQKPKAK